MEAVNIDYTIRKYALFIVNTDSIVSAVKINEMLTK